MASERRVCSFVEKVNIFKTKGTIKRLEQFWLDVADEASFLFVCLLLFFLTYKTAAQ